jgi:UDPglucose 6-dehydrogenase/GDP-mannose 6-dehydrogenase
VDVVDVMEGVHLSRYLTVRSSSEELVRAPLSSYLEAGCGFGGSCLPKDVRALIAEGERLGELMPILRAALETNERQPAALVRLVEGALGNLDGRDIGVLGLAFKPDTDDTRESPAVPVVRELLERGAVVRVHDPVVRELPIELRVDGVSLLSDLEEVVRPADAVVLVTRWAEYDKLPAVFARLETQPALIDGRRMLAKASVDTYIGVGGG